MVNLFLVKGMSRCSGLPVRGAAALVKFWQWSAGFTTNRLVGALDLLLQISIGLARPWAVFEKRQC